MTDSTQITPPQVEAVIVTRGQIAYADRAGKPKIFVFQANPTSLTRSRSITLTQSQVAEAHGTKTARGHAGRKYTLKADNWKMEGIEINLEVAQPYWHGSSSLADAGNLKAVVDALAHLEALAEPGPAMSETDHTKGYPPHPSPPLAELTLGSRMWQGYVTSVRIEEKQFTPDLVPTRIKATLSFEVIVTVQQLDLGKLGGAK